MTDGLLLLHALPVDARMWEPQLAAFPDGLAVAAPDLPGFGGTEPAGDVMTMGAAAERALEALGERGSTGPSCAGSRWAATWRSSCGGGPATA